MKDKIIKSKNFCLKTANKKKSGYLRFLRRTPVKYFSKRQVSVQTSTFGAEFVSLKRAVEEAVTIRYYLRSMGVKVSKPTIIYGDNLSAIRNTVDPGSPVKKKYLALAYHFCREHYGAGIVAIKKITLRITYLIPLQKDSLLKNIMDILILSCRTN